MKGYCPGCSERDLAIRILQDTVGTALSRNPIGMFARGVQDYSHSLIQNPDLRPYQASRRVSELDDRTNSAIPRAKRKVSGYQKEFGRQLKKFTNASIESFLATDTNIFDTATVLINNSPEDNRQIAWGNCLIDLGAGAKGNNTKTQAVANEAYWIDPSHIIQDELNLYLRIGTSDDFEGEVKRVNYIVWMEEVEITDTESIIFNIKGKSQDLSS